MKNLMCPHLRKQGIFFIIKTWWIAENQMVNWNMKFGSCHSVFFLKKVTLKILLNSLNAITGEFFFFLNGKNESLAFPEMTPSQKQTTFTKLHGDDYIVVNFCKGCRENFSMKKRKTSPSVFLEKFWWQRQAFFLLISKPLENSLEMTTVEFLLQKIGGSTQ